MDNCKKIIDKYSEEQLKNIFETLIISKENHDFGNYVIKSGKINFKNKNLHNLMYKYLKTINIIPNPVIEYDNDNEILLYSNENLFPKNKLKIQISDKDKFYFYNNTTLDVKKIYDSDFLNSLHKVQLGLLDLLYFSDLIPYKNSMSKNKDNYVVAHIKYPLHEYKVNIEGVFPMLKEFINLKVISCSIKNKLYINSFDSNKLKILRLHMDLYNNEIPDFTLIPNLIELDLSRNNLTKLPLMSNLKKLKILNLSSNNIDKELDLNYSFPFVEKLFINFNKNKNQLIIKGNNLILISIILTNAKTDNLKANIITKGNENVFFMSSYFPKWQEKFAKKFL